MAAKCVTLAYLLLIVTVVSAQRASYSDYRHDYHIIPYVVDLDTVTFDKVISYQNITVVMFMHFLSYGSKQTEFKHFAESTVTQPTVIAATVGVENVVEMYNWELAVKYNVTMEQLPVIKLFVRGEEIATMEAELLCDNLRSFVTENTGVWVGRVGTTQYLDRLATEFMESNTDQEKEKQLELVREYRDKEATNDDEVKSATYYIWIMEQYVKRGHSFLGMEGGRLKREFARHKMHRANQCGVRKEQNILRTFQNSPVHLPHDEL